MQRIPSGNTFGKLCYGTALPAEASACRNLAKPVDYRRPLRDGNACRGVCQDQRRAVRNGPFRVHLYWLERGATASSVVPATRREQKNNDEEPGRSRSLRRYSA